MNSSKLEEDQSQDNGDNTEGEIQDTELQNRNRGKRKCKPKNDKTHKISERPEGESQGQWAATEEHKTEETEKLKRTPASERVRRPGGDGSGRRYSLWGHSPPVAVNAIFEVEHSKPPDIHIQHVVVEDILWDKRGGKKQG